MSLTKKELIQTISNNTLVSHVDVEKVLNELRATVQQQLVQGEDVVLHGIGKLSTQAREAREGRNPSTGEPIQIAAKRVVKFSATKALKDAVA